MNELPQQILIENYVVEIEMLESIVGLLGADNIFEIHGSINDTGNGLIFMAGGYTISLIWAKNFLFLFDSHSRDGSGAFSADGSSIVLSFKSHLNH